MSCWRGIQTRFVSTLLFKHTSCKSRHVINCHPQQLRYFFLTCLGVHWWGNKQTLLHMESCGGSLLVWGSSPVAVMMMCVIISHLPGEIILRPNKASNLLMQQNPCVHVSICALVVNNLIFSLSRKINHNKINEVPKLKGLKKLVALEL